MLQVDKPAYEEKVAQMVKAIEVFLDHLPFLS
jgi:hypothetical protein